MNEQSPTIEEAMEQVTCPGCLSVPLSVLQLEVSPIQGWDTMLEGLGIKQVTDHLGRKAVSAAGARRLLATLRRHAELQSERADLRFGELEAKHRVVPGGLPIVEGMSALESLTVSPGYQTPQDEYQGIPRPRFLQEELAASQRADDEKKRLAAERQKQRLADQMKDKLGGKR